MFTHVMLLKCYLKLEFLSYWLEIKCRHKNFTLCIFKITWTFKVIVSNRQRIFRQNPSKGLESGTNEQKAKGWQHNEDIPLHRNTDYCLQGGHWAGDGGRWQGEENATELSDWHSAVFSLKKHSPGCCFWLHSRVSKKLILKVLASLLIFLSFSLSSPSPTPCVYVCVCGGTESGSLTLLFLMSDATVSSTANYHHHFINHYN